MGLRIVEGVAISRLVPAPPGGTVLTLNVVFSHQRQRLWCWAACCEMIFHFLGTNQFTQCDLATNVFAQPCCATPSSPACNQPLWPEVVYKGLKFPFTKTMRSLTLEEVRKQIDNNRPVQAYIQWSGTGAHVVLLTGYYGNGDVVVMDPLSDAAARKSFDAVTSADGMGQWTMTYHDLGGSVGV